VLLNAVKAMPTGGTLRVSTYFRSGLPSAGLSNGLVVEFQDTGKVISRENIAKVFDPFFTTDEPGRGTGLGLYVSYQIIKHSAEIEISSDLGEGTTVTITFPELVTAEEAKEARLPVEWV
jgi:signal transduction histidine kinase